MVLSDIRKSAREALTGKWGKGALIILTYFAFMFVLGFISGFIKDVPFLGFVFEIATIVISVPLAFGLIASFIKLKRGEEVKCYEFLNYGFANFGRSWKIAGNILLKIWLPILLYALATIVFIFSTTFGLFATAASGSSSFLAIASIISIILFIAAFAYLFVKSLLYSFVYFIAYDNETMEAKEIVEESAKLMKGNRGKFVLLQFSFIGWAILTVFTLYIGMFWLIPYMQVAMVCFYEALKDKKVEE